MQDRLSAPLLMGVAGLGALALSALPALANEPVSGAAKVQRFAQTEEILPVVAPGEEIGIACEALEYTAPDNDVRVVLTLSAAPSSAPAPGYRKVLATNELLSKGAVHVRIPQMPELANRTVQVDVYVVSASGARNCDAGHMRIADTSQKRKGKQS